MYRYYCSGFDLNNPFGHGLGDMFKSELRDTKSIVYIPGSPEKVEKAKLKYVPAFTEHFNKVGISFENVSILAPETDKTLAKELIKNASFIMLMGGDPFKQKKMCEDLDIISDLKNFNGVMLGYSAGAMLMSKYIIITPCSNEYPDFHIEEGMNLDGISIYPHNNTSSEDYPETLDVGDETYKREDLIMVAQEYGDYYLLQDNINSLGEFDISLVKSTNGELSFYTENEGKIWTTSAKQIKLTIPSKK